MGELAWQLGGKAAFDRIAEDDALATNPGDALRELFVEYGPSLILIDEWVAYARQLHDQSDLPAGGFETQFTFAQALTESAKLAGNCLLVVSLPASDGSSGDDVEVGGVRGREALDRLRNVVGRLESTWRPATAEEGFEIVRRRLFEPMAGDMFKHRDVTARAFADLYRSKPGEFPPETGRSAEYEKRIQAAFPIHPEIFDRLYSDWSTLAKFQRTRGVLRLMAAVIHSLWEKGDRSPLIMPATIPIDDQRVQFELTRYLSDNWVPIIEKDVDGPNSTPLAIDSQNANLGKLSAARRVARTIYLGSAPTTAASQRGLEDRRVKLGCAMPGEAPEVFGDALRRLAGAATYLYQDGSRYWYGTQPTVTKLADDRAEQLKREPDRIAEELDTRIRRNTKDDGGFSRVHPLPRSGADVPDDLDARLVVLSFDHPYSKEENCPAEVAAAAILESRGNAPRLFRNTLVFLAADKVRLQDLDEALRRYLAWEQIVEEANTLNLDPHQKKQAETQKQAADSVVTARLPETYQWLLVPEQKDAKSPVALKAYRLTGSDALAVRAAKKLKNDELLVGSLGSTILRKHLDEVPLWRSDNVGVRQLIDDFASYPYLPRLTRPDVLLRAAQEGVGLLTWRTDAFAYAEGFDEAKKRYTGIRAGKEVMLSADSTGLLVKPEVASRQLDSELPAGDSKPAPTPDPSPPSGPAPKTYRRFHGAVSIDATRAGRDAGRIAEEVIAHLAGQMAAEVTVTIEIEARLPNGASDQLIRTVTENGRTLKFSSLGFEEE